MAIFHASGGCWATLLCLWAQRRTVSGSRSYRLSEEGGAPAPGSTQDSVLRCRSPPLRQQGTRTGLAPYHEAWLDVRTMGGGWAKPDGERQLETCPQRRAELPACSRCCVVPVCLPTQQGYLLFLPTCWWQQGQR